MTDPELLASYLDALRPIVYMNNFDFSAADNLIAEAVKGEAVEEYNNAQGGVHFATKVPRICTPDIFSQSEEGAPSVAKLGKFLDRFITDATMRKVLVLKDVHKEIVEPSVIAQLKAIALRTMQEEDYWVPVIIVSTRLEIPSELEKLVTVFDIAYPSKEQIAGLLDDYSHCYNPSLPLENLKIAFPPKPACVFRLRAS